MTTWSTRWAAPSAILRAIHQRHGASPCRISRRKRDFFAERAIPADNPSMEKTERDVRSFEEPELLLLQRTLMEIADFFQISTPAVDRMGKQHPPILDAAPEKNG